MEQNMEQKLQNIKLDLLKSIGKVYDQAKGCMLEDAFLEKVGPDLKPVSDYFNVPQKQALIVSLVFALNYDSYSVNIQNLSNYLACRPMKLLEYSEDFDGLFTKEILKEKDDSDKGLCLMSNHFFTINEKIMEAIMKNRPMPSFGKEKPGSVIKLLEAFYLLGVQRDDEEITTKELFEMTDDLFHSCLAEPLIMKINGFGLGLEDLTIYMYTIWKAVTGTGPADLERVTTGIFDDIPQKVEYVQKLLSKESKLIEQDLVEITDADFFSDAEIRLTPNSVEMLKELGIKFFTKKKKSNMIEPAKINPVALFFNEPEEKQLGFLKTLLQEEHFAETQKRLQNKGLPKGITVLLHGAPGTGKTETVYQFARETGREIFKVEMSQSKSMWFGESEKIVKRIFTEYRACAKSCERMPVLLFNEADAIISKRRDSGSSNVAQTENTIQNIILEELENFEGIFFATTNLVSNLDPAFERRFLFKIEFLKPDFPVKSKIWKSKLPNLSQQECETLAGYFDFSGGQINNIVRKNEIHEIIYGLNVNFDTIVDYCKTELITKNHGPRIGFTNA